MAISTTRNFSTRARERAAFFDENGEPKLNVEGLVKIANSDGEVIDPATGAAAATGGGSSTYSTAQGDFTATPTVGTTNITVTGLPFTLEDQHVVNGSIKRIDSDGVISTVDSGNISVSGGVITLSEAEDFATGDSVIVSVTGPDKAYDIATDSNQVYVINPEYAHYTSPAHLVEETNTADATTSRYVIPFEAYKNLSLHADLVSGAAADTITVTFWATNNSDADDSADTDWVDISNDLFGAASISANNTTTEGIYFLDSDHIALKYMVKVVVAAGGTPVNSTDIYVKKA